MMMFRGQLDEQIPLALTFRDLPASARVEEVFVKFACQKNTDKAPEDDLAATL